MRQKTRNVLTCPVCGKSYLEMRHYRRDRQMRFIHKEKPALIRGMMEVTQSCVLNQV